MSLQGGVQTQLRIESIDCNFSAPLNPGSSLSVTITSRSIFNFAIYPRIRFSCPKQAALPIALNPIVIAAARSVGPSTRYRIRSSMYEYSPGMNSPDFDPLTAHLSPRSFRSRMPITFLLESRIGNAHALKLDHA